MEWSMCAGLSWGDERANWFLPPKEFAFMLKPVHGLLTIALTLGAITPQMHAADLHQRNAKTVFVLSNDNRRNEVLTYELGDNGQFEPRYQVATGGRGSGGTTDPLQSQGAL